MVINAIEMTLLMVKTTNLGMNYGLQMKAMSAIENMSRQIGKTGWALRFVTLQKSQWSEIN